MNSPRAPIKPSTRKPTRLYYTTINSNARMATREEGSRRERRRESNSWAGKEGRRGGRRGGREERSETGSER
jgi:hypothetical protein